MHRLAVGADDTRRPAPSDRFADGANGKPALEPPRPRSAARVRAANGGEKLIVVAAGRRNLESRSDQRRNSRARGGRQRELVEIEVAR